jgi:hypothetical protein
LWKRLRDSQNPIVKKEKVREKGFVIARIPSWKKKKARENIVKKEKSSWERLRDSPNSIVKKEAWDNKKLWPKKSHPRRDSHRKKARDNNKLWPKIPSTKGFPPKRPETAISCGLESHQRRDFHKFAWRFRSSECVRGCLQIFLKRKLLKSFSW